MQFKDHFSSKSENYARYRPAYPKELFGFLAGLSPAHEHAWDCATGNGQAARGLAEFFSQVSATDASGQQLANAMHVERVTFSKALAEDSGLASNSVDLITVAQALHWFDLERFYTEARRVLKKDGIIAAWTYELARIGETPDAIVKRYYEEITGPFWPPERVLVDAGYSTMAFPFEIIAPPKFELRIQWSVDDMLGYLGTWSGTKNYMTENGTDPRGLIAGDLRMAWGPDRVREVRWPLVLRVGRHP